MATADWTEEHASRWAGDEPKTLPPISVNSIWAFLELNQVRWRLALYFTVFRSGICFQSGNGRFPA
jgi:hypothetical protein